MKRIVMAMIEPRLHPVWSGECGCRVSPSLAPPSHLQWQSHLTRSRLPSTETIAAQAHGSAQPRPPVPSTRDAGAIQRKTRHVTAYGRGVPCNIWTPLSHPHVRQTHMPASAGTITVRCNIFPNGELHVAPHEVRSMARHLRLSKAALRGMEVAGL